MSNTELKKLTKTDIMLKGISPLGILKNRESFVEKYKSTGYDNVGGVNMEVHNSLGKLKISRSIINKPKRKLYENALFN